LIEHLKVIFLQDSILLRERWPYHFNFQQPLFRSPNYTRFTTDVLTACRNPKVSYNKQVHTVIPEITIKLQSLRRENHSDFEIMRRELQLDNQYILRLLFNMLDMFREVSIILPAVTTALNFRAS